MPFTDHLTMLELGFAICLGAAFYPALWWFLRQVKKIPVRFNVTVWAAIFSAGLLPLEVTGFVLCQSANNLHVLSTLLSVEQRLHDYTLICDSDPKKVRQEQIDEAKQRLAAGSASWFRLADKNEISSAQWMTVANPCDYHDHPKPDPDEHKFEKTPTWMVYWFGASLVTAVVGILAVFSLATSRVREDLQEAQAEQPITLKGGEWIWIAIFCWFGLFPYSLCFLRLFKGQKSSPKHGRGDVVGGA